MKATVLYYNHGCDTWTDKEGKQHVNSEIFLVREAQNGKGLLPMEIRAWSAKDGSKVYADARHRVPAVVFEKYQPKPMDVVDVSFNQYGRIESIVKM